MWPPRGAPARGDGGCDAVGAAASADLRPRPSVGAPGGEVVAGASDVTLHTADGLELGACSVPATGRVDTGMAVLVAPGNGGNRAGRAGFAEQLSRRGLAACSWTTAATAATRAAQPGRPPPTRTRPSGPWRNSGTHRMGRLLRRVLGLRRGRGLQARHPPAGIVLRSPFTELAGRGRAPLPWLPVRALLRDRYPVVEHLATSDVPTTVIYGDRDSWSPRCSAPASRTGPIPGRARRHRGCRPQRRRHVRPPGGRRGRTAGAGHGVKGRTPMPAGMADVRGPEGSSWPSLSADALASPRHRVTPARAVLRRPLRRCATPRSAGR